MINGAIPMTLRLFSLGYLDSGGNRIMPEPEVIFSTVHGSRLYGFAHEGSDYDTFTVTTSRSRTIRQAVDAAGNDRVVVGLDHFLTLAAGGSHQSCEALFSPVKEWSETGERYRPMLDSMRVTGRDVFEKYERTIRKFCYLDFKRRRHAARLTMNLTGLRVRGWFNPQLGRFSARYCTHLAETLSGDALAMRLGVHQT